MRGEKKTLDKKGENLKLRKIAQKQKMKERGITLIALVVTIIILLILAGVTLNIALSDNGLFSKAKKAADDYNQKSIEEELQILYAEKQMENYENKSSGKADVTELLEEKLGEGNITQENINDFNNHLKQYGEEIKGISSTTDFAKIGQEGETEYPIDGIYVQLSDISLDSGFTPIGTEENPFTGVYNGNGKSIKSLTITSTEENTGMFGVNGGTIKNVKIENCTITSEYAKVGAIAGKNIGLIEKCSIEKGEISSSGEINKDESRKGSRVGGICGENDNKGRILDCSNSANVSGLCRGVGGICGIQMNGTVNNCLNTGKISGNSGVGGIDGTTSGDKDSTNSISNCVNRGEIVGELKEGTSENGDVGGIVGASWFKIEGCKNEGSITNTKNCCGGIAGYNWGMINNCINTAKITCTRTGNSASTGGIVGGSSGSISKCSNNGQVVSEDDSYWTGGVCGYLRFRFYC